MTPADYLLRILIAALALFGAVVAWAIWRLVAARDSVLDSIIGDDPWEDDR